MSDRRPNVLFLLTDQHNYRCLGHRPDGLPVRTPNLDALAERSAVLEQTYCGVPLCTPSRFTMLTGKHAPAAGAWGNAYVLDPAHETLPGAFGAAGYATGLLGKMHLGGSLQYAGFDRRPFGDLTGLGGHQHEPPGPNTVDLASYTRDVGESIIPASLTQERRIVEESLAFVRDRAHADPDDPWLLCASFARPHWPRRAPRRFLDRYWPDDVPAPDVTEGVASGHGLTERIRESYGAAGMTDEETARARAAYFACVDYVDEVVGDLLSGLERSGLLEDTIVVYASDHGEMAGEYGLWEKRIWHEDAARVPLFVQLPGHRSGEVEPARLSTPVSLVDLLPTLCGLAGVPAPDDVEGHDLAGAIRTGEEPDRGPVFVDHLADFGGAGRYRMARDGRFKYVRFEDGTEFFFDLEADPRERDGSLETATGGAAEALDRLRELVGGSIDFDREERRRREAERRAAEYPLGGPRGTGNAYQLATGRVVDADTPLYRPHVLVERPEAVYDDYPGPS